MKRLIILMILTGYCLPISYTNIYKHSAKLAKKYDIPQDIIIAVARAESDLIQSKVSKKGATGIMQIMPICYKHYKQKNPKSEYTNFSIMKTSWRANMDVGTWYLKRVCYKKFGNWKQAITAYFWGPNSKKITQYYLARVIKKSNLRIN